eukprot:Opistho-2@30235
MDCHWLRNCEKMLWRRKGLCIALFVAAVACAGLLATLNHPGWPATQSVAAAQPLADAIHSGPPPSDAAQAMHWRDASVPQVTPSGGEEGFGVVAVQTVDPVPLSAAQQNQTTRGLLATLERIERLYGDGIDSRGAAPVVATRIRTNDLRQYQRGFKMLGLTAVEFDALSPQMGSAAGILCLGHVAERDSECVPIDMYRGSPSRPLQRIARIYGMRHVLWRKNAFCDTMMAATEGYARPSDPRRLTPAFTPLPCFFLPRDASRFESHAKDLHASQATEGRRDEQKWIVKPANGGGGSGIKVVDGLGGVLSLCNGIRGNSNAKEIIAQPYVGTPLLIDGHKFDLRIYLVVMSVSPLRLYMYSEGLVRFASVAYDHNATDGGSKEQYLTNTSINKKVKAIDDLVWSFAHLRSHLADNGADPDVIFGRIHMHIAMAFVASEPAFRARFKDIGDNYTCAECYHFLGVDVIINSDLQPSIIEMNGLADLSDNLPAMKATLVAATLDIVFNGRHARFSPPDVLRELHGLGVGYHTDKECTDGASTVYNHTAHGGDAATDGGLVYWQCVDDADIEHIVASRNELVHLPRGGFTRIYPSHSVGSAESFTEFLDHVASRMPAATRGTRYYHPLMMALSGVWMRDGMGVRLDAGEAGTPARVKYVFPEDACTMDAAGEGAPSPNATTAGEGAWSPPPCLTGLPSVDDDRRLRH